MATSSWRILRGLARSLLSPIFTTLLMSTSLKCDLLAKKSIQAILVEAHTGEGDAVPALKRTLGAWQLTMLGIGVVIGAGLFSLTGKVAADNAGPRWCFPT